MYLYYGFECIAKVRHLFETSAEIVAEGGVDERVEAAVEEAGPVRGEHREEEL